MKDKLKLDQQKIPQHIAVIMDGNGRWAKKRFLNRIKGHQAGVKAIRETVEVCREIGVKYLTLYAFSVENWTRPKKEVEALMKLLKEFLNKELKNLKKNNIRLETIGRIENLPQDVQAILKVVKKETGKDYKMTLVLALNYGGRTEIIDGIKKIYKNTKGQKGQVLDIDNLNEENFARFLYTKEIPDPDLLIRTSGEIRVSNFLLWQISYTEFYFTEVLWPDFGRKQLLLAIDAFQNRQRRFGKVI